MIAIRADHRPPNRALPKIGYQAIRHYGIAFTDDVPVTLV